MNDTSMPSAFATTPGALPADANTRSDGASGNDLPGAAPIASDDLLGPTSSMGSMGSVFSAESMDAVFQRADAWMQRCRTEVRAHPMGALAAAFFAGMLVDRMRRPGRRA